MAHSAANGGALGARVDNLESAVTGLRSDIAALAIQLRDNQKTPWGTLISGAGFIVVIMMAFLGLFASNIDGRINDNREAIKDLTGVVVPRGENKEHWDQISARMDDFQREIDQQRSEYGNTYSLRDELKDLHSKVDQLYGAPNASNSSQPQSLRGRN